MPVIEIIWNFFTQARDQERKQSLTRVEGDGGEPAMLAHRRSATSTGLAVARWNIPVALRARVTGVRAEGLLLCGAEASGLHQRPSTAFLYSAIERHAGYGIVHREIGGRERLKSRRGRRRERQGVSRSRRAAL